MVLLVRHGATDAVGTRLCGRGVDAPLNRHGREEAARVAALLRSVPLAAVYTSPLSRARETAAPIAAAHAIEPIDDEALNEIDFGEWTGLSFSQLESRRDWRHYNESRSSGLIPRGESPSGAAARAGEALARISSAHPGSTIVAVTHAELIRYTVLSCLNASIDRWQTIDIPTASITPLRIGPIDRTLLAPPTPPASFVRLVLA